MVLWNETILQCYKESFQKSYFVPGRGECIGTLPFTKAVKKAEEQAKTYARMKNFIIVLKKDYLEIVIVFRKKILLSLFSVFQSNASNHVARTVNVVVKLLNHCYDFS